MNVSLHTLIAKSLVSFNGIKPSFKTSLSFAFNFTPVIIAERKRLMESYIHGKSVSNSGRLHLLDEERRASMIEEYRQEAIIKYKIANIFTDGAFGLINALQQETLQAAAREFDVTFCKWSAQHSLCQNALDSSVCFSITHSIFETVRNNQSGYSITPADWFPPFCDLIDEIYPTSSARKDAIKVVQSYMGEIRDKAYQATTICKGWIANGMGVNACCDTFDFKVFLSHWTYWKNLSEHEIMALESAFWNTIVPSARRNNFSIDMLTIHDAIHNNFHIYFLFKFGLSARCTNNSIIYGVIGYFSSQTMNTNISSR